MKVFIEGRRETYSASDIRGTMTVRELIEYLEQYDDDDEVMLKNDNGYTYGSITGSSFEEEEDYEDIVFDDDEDYFDDEEE